MNAMPKRKLERKDLDGIQVQSSNLDWAAGREAGVGHFDSCRVQCGVNAQTQYQLSRPAALPLSRNPWTDCHHPCCRAVASKPLRHVLPWAPVSFRNDETQPILEGLLFPPISLFLPPQHLLGRSLFSLFTSSDARSHLPLPISRFGTIRVRNSCGRAAATVLAATDHRAANRQPVNRSRCSLRADTRDTTPAASQAT